MLDYFTVGATGDIDADGTLTSADVTLAVRYLSGFAVKGAKYSCDVNLDKKINNRDAIEIIRSIANA